MSIFTTKTTSQFLYQKLTFNLKLFSYKNIKISQPYTVKIMDKYIYYNLNRKKIVAGKKEKNYLQLQLDF